MRCSAFLFPPGFSFPSQSIIRSSLNLGHILCGKGSSSIHFANYRQVVLDGCGCLTFAIVWLVLLRYNVINETVYEDWRVPMKPDPYVQKNPFWTKGTILFFLGLASLVGSLCSLLARMSLLISLFLFAVGLIMEVLWLKALQSKDNEFLTFIEGTSSFEHPLKSPLVISELLQQLNSEGFEIKEYPYGNYYGQRQWNRNSTYHFFISNNETPDCKEVEEYSTLFIQKIMEAGNSYGSQFFVAFEYGPEIQKRSPEFVEVCRQGFMVAKEQGAFGYRIAYDTTANILYYAEAITNVVWVKTAAMGRYTSELFQKLFVLED